jgi:hypothetical protein
MRLHADRECGAETETPLQMTKPLKFTPEGSGERLNQVV